MGIRMKFCTKCGNQMTDEMVFCQKCGTKSLSFSSVQSKKQEIPIQTQNPKLRTGMKVWMIISFVFAGIFALCCTADMSMLAGVCLFGILGFMFLFLAKSPKGSSKLFTDASCFKKTQGISKGAFVGISSFLAFFLFIAMINTFETDSTYVHEAKNNNTSTVTKEEQKEKQPEIPAEFSDECPISVSVSLYDNIIGYPELSCYIQNKLQWDMPISSNGADTAVWQIIDQNVKSGDLYVYSVYFSDGTEWGNRNAPVSTIKKYGMQLQVSY